MAGREHATALFQGQRLEFDAAHRDGHRRDAETLIGFAVPIDWADLEAAAWLILAAGGAWDDLTADWVVSSLLWEGMDRVTEARAALTRLPADAGEGDDRVRLREQVTALFGPHDRAPGPVAPVVALRLAGAR